MNIQVKKGTKKLSPSTMAQKTKPESKKSRMRAYHCGTTLMSLVTLCTLASLLLSLGKNCLSIKKKLKPPSTQVSFFMFQSFILQHTFRRKTYGKFLKRGVCMLHVKDSENKVPGKWHLKHDNRYFHAQLLHITDITRCRSPSRPTRFRQKKSSLHGQAWQIIKLEEASLNEATVPNQQQAQQSTHARHTLSPCPIRFCQKISTSPKLL